MNEKNGGLIVINHHFDSDSSKMVNLPPRVSQWLEKLNRLAAVRRKGVIDAVVKERKPHPIYSLAGFFNTVAEDGSIVAVDWELEGLKRPEAKVVATKFLEDIAKFDLAVEKLRQNENLSPKDVLEITELYDSMTEIFTTTHELGRLVHSVQDLLDLKEKKVAWHWFYAEDFSGALELRSRIEDLIDIAQSEQP